MQRIQFKDVATEWLGIKRKLVKRSTFCAYSLIVHTHLLPGFGEKTSVTEAEAQAMVLEKINSGLARKSVRDILAVLKAIAKHGIKYHGWKSVIWEIEFPTEWNLRKLPVLSKSSHRKLLRYLTASPTPQNIGILIALCTGMRIGEVCALRWKDVDMRAQVMTVRNTIGRIYDVEKKSTEKIISSPKTRSSNREIPICRDLLLALRSIRITSKTAEYVVGNSDTAKEPRSYRDYFSRLLKKLNIPKIVFHGLRHTFVTRCIECRCDYKTISTLLGHANVSTTMNLYVHPDITQKKRCIDRMQKHISK